MKEKRLGIMIKIIHWHIDQAFNEFLKKDNLTISQARVIHYLCKHKDKEVVQRDIEKFFRVSNPTVSGILNRLEEKGFVVRTTSENDKRIKVVILTEKALELDDYLRNSLNNYEEEMMACLSQEEKNNLLDSMDKIINAMMNSKE